MIHPLSVRNIILGDGNPKICVPLTADCADALADQLSQLSHAVYDLVEWRLDYLAEDADYPSLYAMIRRHLPDTPLLATFRSLEEGGMRSLDNTAYTALGKLLIRLGSDLIDVEWRRGRGVMEELLAAAHAQQALCVASNHDFHHTPPQEEIVRRLRSMQEWGADLLKIAVMPRNAEDVITLLSASEEMARLYADRPIITMSMGHLGLMSRLCGNISGSAITFGSAACASAPGQIDSNVLRQTLNLLNC